MKYKKGLLFICLIICLFTIASVCASDVNETMVTSDDQNTDITENQIDVLTSNENETIRLIENQNDELKCNYINEDNNIGVTDENELGASVGSFTDLANEIKNSNGEYNLSRNYCSDEITNRIVINESIIINGNGFTLQGDGSTVQGISVSAKNVILNNISFKNAPYPIDWCGIDGGIYNCKFINCSEKDMGTSCVSIYSPNLLIENCTFIDCFNIITQDKNPRRGGVISAFKENYTINNCNFTNCYISVSNYATINSYGGVFYSYKSGTISNCNFNNCCSITSDNYQNLQVTSKSHGGAICFEGDKLNVVNSTFIDCSAKSLARAPSAYYQGEQVVQPPTDTEANAYSYGGSISLIKGEAVVENCNFTNSIVMTSTFGSAANFNLKSYGGAIYSRATKLSILDCFFDKCIADEGGAIYLDHYKYSDETTYVYINSIADIENCIFIENHATNAGAIFEYNNGTIITSCEFINNAANNDSGAVYVINDYDFLSDCIFINNSADNNGAAVMWKGNDGTISSSIFVNNTATKDSGIYIDGGNNFVKDSILLSNNQYPVIFSDTQVVTANYNWWGNTIHNYNQKPTVPTRINVKNWLFMNFTVDANSLKVGEIATVTCDLTHLTTPNGIISKYDAFDLPIINLTVIADNNFNTTINMIGGICCNTHTFRFINNQI